MSVDPELARVAKIKLVEGIVTAACGIVATVAGAVLVYKYTHSHDVDKSPAVVVSAPAPKPISKSVDRPATPKAVIGDTAIPSAPVVRQAPVENLSTIPGEKMGQSAVSSPVFKSEAPPSNATDPVVLRRCKGLEPLEATEIRVQLVSDGFQVTLGLRNPTSTPYSVLATGFPFADMTTDAGDVLHTVDGLQPEGKFTFWHGQIDPNTWNQTFMRGLAMDPGDLTSFPTHFQKQGVLHSASSADVMFQLLYLYKDAAETRLLRRVRVSCSEVPVIQPRQR